MFPTTVVWFGGRQDCYWFDLGKLFEGHIKIIINFLNGIPYISLHISFHLKFLR